jgi:hypothetical protein
VREFLASCKLDMQNEWEDQLIVLHDHLGMREWFKRVAGETLRREALIQDSDRDPADVVLRRTAALLEEIKATAPDGDLVATAEHVAPYEARLIELRDKAARIDPTLVDARYALYFAACRLRREVMFANPLLDFDSVIFIKRHFMPGEVNFPFFIGQGWCALGGGSGLFVLENAFSASPTLRDLLADSTVGNGRMKGRTLSGGAFLGPELSYDASEILFAFTEVPEDRQEYVWQYDDPSFWTEYTWEPDRYYHVFRAKMDGTELRQLTDGPQNDFDPCWLPNGGVLFVSDRRGGFTRSRWWYLPGHTLYSMDPDGSDVRRLSHHLNQEWQPTVDNQGTVVFTRYDYWDRSYTSGFSCWLTTPDGRDARALHANYRGDKSAPATEGDIRAIPGSDKLIATASPNVFGHIFGSLILIDPSVPDQLIRIGNGAYDKVAFTRLTPDHHIPYSEADRSSGSISYGTAYPLSETTWLCAYDCFSGTYNGVNNNYGIYLMDALGNKELLYRDPSISCMSPMPLKPRPRPPIIPDLCKPPPAPVRENADPDAPGTVGVINVYNSTLPMPEGAKIMRLRIWEIHPKTTPIKDRPRTRFGDNSGQRSLLGSVPVEDDGSSFFTMPANIPVFFQAIDEDGCAVQTMRSDTYIHPGERRLCLGCHEPRTRAPSVRPSFAKAFQREPSGIEPDADGTYPFNYARLVQPVLDEHCVSCHLKGKGKAPDLTAGDWRRDPARFYQSAHNLYPHLARSINSFNQHLGQSDRSVPGEFGARASKLYHMLTDQRGHKGLKIPEEDLHRLVVWMDSSASMWGYDRDLDKQAAGEIVTPARQPVNDVTIDRSYGRSSMYPGGAQWLISIKDTNGFERPMTDAIQPGIGFRLWRTPQEAFDFAKAESYPLVGFYEREHRLRVETAPVDGPLAEPLDRLLLGRRRHHARRRLFGIRDVWSQPELALANASCDTEVLSSE